MRNKCQAINLRDALGLAAREVVSFVGGGGKTAALRVLTHELAKARHTVVVTTTAKMYREQLAGVGKLIIHNDYDTLGSELRRSLNFSKVIAFGGEALSEGKVRGLPANWVDELWRLGHVDYIIVEADGSQGKSLKAPAAHEPVIPESTTTIVPVVGLDVLGKPLTAEFVHRPELVASIGEAAPGSLVTTALVAGIIAHPAGPTKGKPPEAGIVPLINKAESDFEWPVARKLASEILEVAEDIRRVVYGSCREYRFSVVQRT